MDLWMLRIWVKIWGGQSSKHDEMRWILSITPCLLSISPCFEPISPWYQFGANLVKENQFSMLIAFFLKKTIIQWTITYQKVQVILFQARKGWTRAPFLLWHLDISNQINCLFVDYILICYRTWKWEFSFLKYIVMPNLLQMFCG